MVRRARREREAELNELTASIQRVVKTHVGLFIRLLICHAVFKLDEKSIKIVFELFVNPSASILKDPSLVLITASLTRHLSLSMTSFTKIKRSRIRIGSESDQIRIGSGSVPGE